MDNFKYRLIFLFGSNASRRKISKAIGLSYHGLNHVWEKGGVPKVDTMINIQQVTGCDLNWLLTGKGEAFPEHMDKNASVSMATLKERLVFLFGTDVGPTQIAKKIGMTYPGFSRIWYDGSTPKVGTMIHIQQVTGCDLNWLLTGKGEPFPAQADKHVQAVPTPAKELKEPAATYNVQHQEKPQIPAETDGYADNLPVDTVFIPRYNAQALAEHSCFNEYEQNTPAMPFSRYWIKNCLYADPNDLSVITVKGDSMIGVLNDGDNILINHAKNQPGDGLYVFRINETLMVKRTQPMPGNQLLVTSTNEAYKPFTLDLTQPADDIEIIGKVEWVGRKL